MMKKIFPRSEEDASLIARMSPLWTKAIIDGVKLFESESEPKVSITLTIGQDPRLQKALERRVIQGKKVNDTTEEDLRAILATAFDEGLTTVEIGDKIAEYYAANGVGEESARSMTAAMTQTTGCVNDGLKLAAQDVGGLEKYWIHGNPKEPRPSHLQAAETYSEDNAIPLDEPFVVDGEELDAPGDESASMENVCNCTCILGFRKAKSGATEQSGEIANEE
jgi:hypothetical protein